VRHASSLAAGLVGMPNVGKSTLFNALVGQQLAQASNFPFCTIEPNFAAVAVPDERLDTLARLHSSRAVKQQQIEFYDIAGLVKGASAGAGLGNKFLDNIRAVSAVLQVVRCFDDAGVVHVEEGPQDPVRDIRIIEGELLLADIQSVERRLGAGARAGKGLAGAAAAAHAEELRLLRLAQGALEAGRPARSLSRAELAGDGGADAAAGAAAAAAFARLQLLTQKPLVYVCNVGEADAAGGNAMTRAVQDFAAAAGGGACVVSAKIEAELALLGAAAERREMLLAYGLQRSGLDAVVAAAADALGLLTFYTVGPQEARAWRVRAGACAPAAAGEIHSDLEATFIKAEVISYEDIVRHGGDEGARKAGVCRSEGRDYVVRDGDVMLFKAGGAMKKR